MSYFTIGRHLSLCAVMQLNTVKPRHGTARQDGLRGLWAGAMEQKPPWTLQDLTASDCWHFDKDFKPRKIVKYWVIYWYMIKSTRSFQRCVRGTGLDWDSTGTLDTSKLFNWDSTSCHIVLRLYCRVLDSLQWVLIPCRLYNPAALAFQE